MFKIMFKILKKVVIGMVLLFGYNTFLSSLNLIIPINVITIIIAKITKETIEVIPKILLIKTQINLLIKMVSILVQIHNSPEINQILLQQKQMLSNLLFLK